MNDLPDLAERLEQALSSSPPAPPASDYLAAGRRRLLRRRIGSGIAGLAVAAAVGLPFVLTGGDGDRAVDVPPAAPGGDAVEVLRSDDVDDVGLMFDGRRIVAHPDAVVVDRIDEPLGWTAPDASVAVQWTFEGDAFRAVFAATDSGQGATALRSADTGVPIDAEDFAAWVDFAAVSIALDLGLSTSADVASRVRPVDAGRLAEDSGGIELGADCVFRVAPGVAVDQVDAGLERDGQRGAAIEWTAPDRTSYRAVLLSDCSVSGDSSVYGGPVGDPGQTFTEFLADYESTESSSTGTGTGSSGSGSSAPESPDAFPVEDLVTIADDGALTAAPGVEILEQTSDVVLANFTDPAAGDLAAAALVRVEDGDDLFVLARSAGGAKDYIGHAITDDTGPDLDGFLRYAAARYESGEGLL